MNNRPITEEDLHAYVDCVLEPERRVEVDAYLNSHPDVAKRVGAFADQRDVLRAALAPIADEPLPPKLNLSRIIQQSRRGRTSPAWWAIATMLLVSIGGFCGGGAPGARRRSARGGVGGAPEAGACFNSFVARSMWLVRGR